MRVAGLVMLAACAASVRDRVRVEAPDGAALGQLELVSVPFGPSANDTDYGGNEDHIDVFLDRLYLGRFVRTDRQFAQLANPSLKAVASPRGDAIAVSFDGGRTYSYAAVWLNPHGDIRANVACFHVALSSPDLLWKRWPDQRSFELDVLLHPDEHLWRDADGRAVEIGEWARIGALALADSDTEVMHAFVKAYLMKNAGFERHLELHPQTPPSLVAVLRSSFASAQVLIDALADPELRGRAALALASTSWIPALDAIAGALRVEPSGPNVTTCRTREKLSWSLAHMLEARDARASAPLHDVVREAIMSMLGTAGCSTPITAHIELDAVRSLAKIGDTATLEQLAAPAMSRSKLPDARPDWNHGPDTIDLAAIAKGIVSE